MLIIRRKTKRKKHLPTATNGEKKAKNEKFTKVRSRQRLFLPEEQPAQKSALKVSYCSSAL